MAAARCADPALLLPAGCEGFSAAQWPALVRLCGAEVGARGAALSEIVSTAAGRDFRTNVSGGNADSTRVLARISKMCMRDGYVVLEADNLRVCPCELFPLVVLLAALQVYAAPGERCGQINKQHVLDYLARSFFAAGRAFGAIRMPDVEAVLARRAPFLALLPRDWISPFPDRAEWEPVPTRDRSRRGSADGCAGSAPCRSVRAAGCTAELCSPAELVIRCIVIRRICTFCCPRRS